MAFTYASYRDAFSAHGIDPASKIGSRIRTLILAGAITVNELRAAYGLPKLKPDPDGDGDGERPVQVRESVTLSGVKVPVERIEE